MVELEEDYTQIALDHNLIQFKASPHIISLYHSLFSPFHSIQEALNELKLKRHLPIAIGKQLDGIGDILGIKRPFTISEGLFYFGFTGQSKAKGYSQAIIRSQSFATGNENFNYMSDALYQRLLKWKMIANNSHGTVEDIIRACQAVFLATHVEVIEGNCRLTVNIKRPKKYASEALESNKEKFIPAAAGIFVTVNIQDEAQR